MPVQGKEYIFADSATRYLSNEEINALSKDEARYALNEIYARRGRLFQSEELQSYFNSKSWYRGTIQPDQFDEALLNAIEKDNVQRLDKRRNGEVLFSSSFKADWIYGSYEYHNDFDALAFIGWYSGTGEDYIELIGSSLDGRSTAEFTAVMVPLGGDNYYAVDEYGNAIYITYNGIDGIDISCRGEFGGAYFYNFDGYYYKTADISENVS